MKTEAQERLELLEYQMNVVLKAVASSMGIDLEAEVKKVKEANELFKSEGVSNTIKPIKTKNQLRRELIEEAQELVDDVIIENEEIYEYSFKVDEDKRTIRLVRLGIEFDEEDNKIYNGKIKIKIAKADEEDVFNADIGKAILIGSMHGLDIKKFTDAVQPDTPVVGSKIKLNKTYNTSFGYVHYGEIVEVTSKINKRGKCQPNSLMTQEGTIVSDTHADYYETEEV